MIMRKTIKKYSTGAHIILPKDKIGETIIVIYDEDLEQFKTMVRNSTLYDSVKDDKIERIKTEVKDLVTRVSFLERFVTSLSNEGRKSNPPQAEQESASPSTV